MEDGSALPAGWCWSSIATAPSFVIRLHDCTTSRAPQPSTENRNVVSWLLAASLPSLALCPRVVLRSPPRRCRSSTSRVRETSCSNSRVGDRSESSTLLHRLLTSGVCAKWLGLLLEVMVLK